MNESMYIISGRGITRVEATVRDLETFARLGDVVLNKHARTFKYGKGLKVGDSATRLVVPLLSSKDVTFLEYFTVSPKLAKEVNKQVFETSE